MTKWRRQHEEILGRYSEISASYAYLHAKSYRKYRKKNIAFSIPVIVLNSLCGAASMSLGHVQRLAGERNTQAVPTANLVIGGLNLCCAIITTISQFLHIPDYTQRHMQCVVEYGKLSRDILHEMALAPDERSAVTPTLTLYKMQLDRLIENAPPLDADIVHNFSKKFEDHDFYKPTICNGVHKSEEFVFKERASDKVAHPLEFLLRESHQMVGTTPPPSPHETQLNEIVSSVVNEVVEEGMERATRATKEDEDEEKETQGEESAPV
jgi:hypothetical protein